MKLNRKLTSSIVVLGGSALLVLGIFGIPSIIGIRQLNQEIANDYLKIERKYQLRQHTRSSLKAMDDLQPKLKRLTQMAIVEGQELAFISALEKAAADSGVIQDLSLETVNQRDISPWEREIPVGLTVAGDYGLVLNYIERVQALPYYIILSSIDITDADPANNAGNGRVRAILRGSIRWFSQQHPIFLRINHADATS